MSPPPPSRRARAAAILERSGLGGMLRRLPLWRGVVVLGYHRIGDPAAGDLDRGVYSATAEDFDEQLALLSRSFEVIGLDDLGEALTRPRCRALMITFDDGYADQLDAARMLHARGLPATFFLATGFLDRPRPAWWDEIAWMVHTSSKLGAADREETIRTLLARYRELPGDEGEGFLDRLAETGGTGRAGPAQAPWIDWDGARELQRLRHAVGGHTVSHPILTRLDRDAQRREIGGCLDRLRTELTGPIDSFAYPSGHAGSFDSGIAEILRENGVRWAFSFRGGHERPGDADPYDVRRVRIFDFHPTPLVAATVSLPFLLAREAR